MDWVLSLVVVTQSEDAGINLKLARVYLTISSDDNAATIPNRLHNSNAETLASRIKITKVPDFINYFTFPKDFTRAEPGHRGPTSCFKNRQLFKTNKSFCLGFSR
ncbi:hypothetical protein BGZ89_005201 [Linnemannia elongata]|nr:hypothetical protein BGZ89_005201 [Linnemannia elongata]